MDTKRILAIIGFLLAVVLLGIALWFVFFREPATPRQPVGVITPTPTGTGAFPEAGTGETTEPVTPRGGRLPSAGFNITPRPGAVPEATVTQVSNDFLLGVNITPDGSAQYYNRTTGQFYRIDANGRVQILSDEIFFNVDKVTWSPTTDESIIEYPDGSNIYYNFDTKRQVTLPKHWEEFSFSPQGDKILSKSLGFSPENRWLVAANPDGTGVRPIEPLGNNADKVIVDWSPNQRVVALSRTGEQLGGDREEVLFVGQNGENFPSVVVEGRGLKSKWSNQGEKLLYSVYSARSEFKPELWIVNSRTNSIGSDRRVLNVNTWADKCAFQDDRYLLCGVPTDIPTGSGFAPSLADQIPDRLVQIDTQTGQRVEIPLRESHTIDTIFYNEAEDAVFFTDKNKSGLFQATL